MFIESVCMICGMRFHFISFLLLCFLPSIAYAKIDILQRDNYDRIVIESVDDGAIQVKEGIIKIPYSLPVEKEVMKKSRSLQNIKVNKNSIELSLHGAVTDTRHFRIGKRVVLDVFVDLKKIAIKTEKETAKTSKEELKQVEKIKTVEEIVPTIIEKQDQKITDKTPVIVDEVAPDLSLAETLPDNANPTIVMISSTTPFGLSVFQRYGRLFIVSDSNNMTVPPQITGAGADLGWEVTEVSMDNGKAWMIPVPDNTYVRPEGSKLIWRLILSDIAPNLKDTGIRRRLIDPAHPEIDIIMSHSTKLLKLHDPDYGDDLAVVTVSHALKRMNTAYDFVDFDIVPAVVGAVIKPESDGLRIASGSQYITITKSTGLVVSSESPLKIIEAYLKKAGKNLSEKITKTTLDRIYYFDDWGKGIEPYEYSEKRKELENFLSVSQADAKLGVLLNLVKLSLSQNMGHEAIGFLELAKDFNNQIENAVEYKALRGVAHYLTHQYDVALKYFSEDELKSISEISLWKAATLASMGRSEEAVENYDDNAVLASIYPYEIKRNVIAPLATALLDENKGADAASMVALLDQNMDDKSLEARATLAYLKGRSQSVTGHPDEAISNLYKASLSDKLGPYGIRSELLLVEDELAREVIKRDEAIQRMERLRFAWRGDDLETQIQKSLGNLYIQSDEPRKGLNILKRAAKNTKSLQDRRAMVRTMADAYKGIFLGLGFADIDPMIAIAIYDEFKELTPVGDEGNALIDGVADKLMGINLLSRATSVLSDKMNRLGEGEDAIKTGLRIAAIQLIDRNPKVALKTLAKVDKMISQYTGENKNELLSKIVLLKARSYSDSGEPETALFMTEGLDDSEDVIRLRVDTAWRSGRWVAVTDNLSKLLARQNISTSTPPTAEQTQLILNQAVALSLSDQYDALQRFAGQYDMVMKQSPSYKTFLLVSRPQNISNLADRETLLGVTAEVDLFKDFLESMNK